METYTRSLCKALAYRTLGSVMSAVLCYVLTGRVAISLRMACCDAVLKSAVYFGHERLWEHVHLCETPGRPVEGSSSGYQKAVTPGSMPGDSLLDVIREEINSGRM